MYFFFKKPLYLIVALRFMWSIVVVAACIFTLSIIIVIRQ